MSEGEKGGEGGLIKWKDRNPSSNFDEIFFLHQNWLLLTDVNTSFGERERSHSYFILLKALSFKLKTATQHKWIQLNGAHALVCMKGGWRMSRIMNNLLYGKGIFFITRFDCSLCAFGRNSWDKSIRVGSFSELHEMSYVHITGTFDSLSTIPRREEEILFLFTKQNKTKKVSKMVPEGMKKCKFQAWGCPLQKLSEKKPYLILW